MDYSDTEENGTTEENAITEKNILIKKIDELKKSSSRLAYVKVIQLFGLIFLVVYCYSMFVHPFLESGFNWRYVQGVWRDWQSLNMGFLAFISSYTIFMVSKQSNTLKHQKEQLAARALLPQALSELLSYFVDCAHMVDIAWQHMSYDKGSSRIGFTNRCPIVPEKVWEIFKLCMQVSDPKIGNYLAEILVDIQVNHSRMKELYSQLSDKNGIRLNKTDLIVYAYALGKLYVMVDNTFNYSRGESDSISDEFDMGIYRLAYRKYKFKYLNQSSLCQFTEKRL